MTTIAYRDGVMASDSGLIGNGIYEGTFSKVLRIWDRDDGTLLMGGAGFAAQVQQFFDWLQGHESHRPEFKPEDRFDALVVQRLNGSTSMKCYDRFLIALEIEAPYLAVGSGRELALGAMYQGADAVQALQAAIKHDTGSIGPVQKVSFG